MLGYLKKFNDLPASVKDKVSNEQALAAIEALERKFNLALAALVMKVMVKELRLDDLPGHLLKENLTPDRADQLTKELKEKIFYSLENYLAVSPAAPAQAFAAEEPAVKGASFFFSPDDEAEIRELARRIDLAEKTALPAQVIETKLKEIIDQARINFGSADLADRFRQILKTYLRGIRNRLETKAALVKPLSSGGLSFDEDSAGKVMSLAGKILDSRAGAAAESRPKINLPEAGGLERDAVYDFSVLEKRKQTVKTKPSFSGVFKKFDTGHELAAPVKTAVRPPLLQRRFEAENLTPSPRVKIEDVKFVPRVMSPLDEIKYMDLLNFRRLDKEAVRAAEKIKNKISLLEEEGYDKRLEAVKLWRYSPLNKLYLQIGQASIGENKPIDVIIEEKKKRREEYLTAEEFAAVMDLNKSLRF